MSISVPRARFCSGELGSSGYFIRQQSQPVTRGEWRMVLLGSRKDPENPIPLSGEAKTGKQLGYIRGYCLSQLSSAVPAKGTFSFQDLTLAPAS